VQHDSIGRASDKLKHITDLTNRVNKAEGVIDILMESALHDAKERLQTVANRVIDFYEAQSRNLSFNFAEGSRGSFVQYGFRADTQLQQFFTAYKFDQSTFDAVAYGEYEQSDDSTANEPLEIRLAASAEAASNRYETVLSICSATAASHQQLDDNQSEKLRFHIGVLRECKTLFAVANKLKNPRTDDRFY
jgi:hypothetical protein